MLKEREFYEEVRANVERVLEEKGMPHKIKMQDILKANDEKLVALAFGGKDVKFTPCIYINQEYERYLEGTSIDEITEDVAMVFAEATEPSVPLEIFDNYERMQDYLNIRLLGQEENKEWLSDKVWEPYGDFAKVCYIALPSSPENQASVTMTYPLLEQLGVSKETVMNKAEENLSKEAYKLRSISSVIDEITGMEVSTELNPYDVMFVLTNNNNTFGATMIAREDVLREVGGILGSNYYVLPSSIHECMIIPTSVGFNLGELSAMVKEVNETTVAPNEKLSDKVQFYDRSRGVLENAEAHQERAERKRGQER